MSLLGLFGTSMFRKAVLTLRIWKCRLPKPMSKEKKGEGYYKPEDHGTTGVPHACKREPEESKARDRSNISTINENFPKWIFDSKPHNQDSEKAPRWSMSKRIKLSNNNQTKWNETNRPLIPTTCIKVKLQKIRIRETVFQRIQNYSWSTHS